jgi:hypothetical protein
MEGAIPSLLFQEPGSRGRLLLVFFGQADLRIRM